MNNSIYSLINYKFNNPSLLETALTHKSVHLDLGIDKKDNERLEFIGDAYLDAVIGYELFSRLKGAAEGELTKKRAFIVCEKSLARVARKLELNKYMRFGHQAILNKVNEKDSVLADCVEAIIGAIFIDSNYDEAKKFILNNFKDIIEEALTDNMFSDYKSNLQEYFQSLDREMNLKYVIDKEEGPDHDKTFYIHVEESGMLLGRGKGKSKKEAEQNAAKESLLVLKKENK